MHDSAENQTRSEMRLEAYLDAELDRLTRADLRRHLRRIDSPQGTRIKLEGRELVNFASNDYLGLCNHPEVKRAAAEAVERWGVGSGASRLVSGNLAPVAELESALAEFKRTEAALVFSSGYTAMLGTVCALAGARDVILLDRLAHACMVDAARLSGAAFRVFRHNDPEDLKSKLEWATAYARGQDGKVFILTESVFSMDGDLAPLREIVALKDKYRAILILDEAHATGVLGPQGRGLAHALGLEAAVDVQMGTLSKALGCVGGFICGSRKLIELLVNSARPFIFTTGIPPAIAAAARRALQIAAGPEGDLRRDRLRAVLDRLGEMLHGRRGLPSAIVPVVLGGEARAVDVARQLLEAGFYVPAIRYPAVRRGAARLRISCTAGHTPADAERLALALRALGVVPTSDHASTGQT